MDKLMVALGLDTSAYKAGINQATQMANTLKSTLTSVAAGLGIGFGLSKLTSYIKEAGDEYIKTAQTVARIGQLLKNENVYSEKKLEYLKKQREEYQKMGIAQEKIADAQYTIEQRYAGANTAFKDKLLKTAVNKGGDYSQNVETIERDMLMATSLMDRGKSARLSPRIALAMGIEANELDKLNESFKTMTTKNQVNIAILDVAAKHYEEEFKAIRAANPFTALTDLLAPLKYSIGQFAVSVGTRLVPELKKGIEWLRDMFEKNKDKIADSLVQLSKNLVSFATGVKETLLPFVDGLISIAKWISPTADGFKTLGEVFATYKIATLLGSFFSLIKGFVGTGLTAAGLGGGGGAAAGGAAIVSAEVLAPIVASILAILGPGIMYKVGWFSNPNSLAAKQTKDFESKALAQTDRFLTDQMISGAQPFMNSPKASQIGELENILKSLNIKYEDSDVKKSFDEYSKNNYNLLTEFINSLNKEGIVQFKKDDEFTRLLNYFRKEKSAENSGQKGENSGQKGGITNTQVKGESARQIIINIHDGLVKSMTNNFNSLQEGADKIEEVITQAILNGIQAGEMLSSGGH